jgi:glutaredoxin
MRTELFGLSTCPYTADMRQWLIALAKTRFLELSGGKCTVPVLVEDGRVVRTGWMGRGCAVGVRR